MRYSRSREARDRDFQKFEALQADRVCSEADKVPLCLFFDSCSVLILTYSFRCRSPEPDMLYSRYI